MGSVILCSGNYAKTPYYIAENDMHLYSVEELCYYLYKNAFLLQEDFFCDGLLEWIRTELDLPVWTEALLQFRDKEECLYHSITYLFKATGYYDEANCEKVHRVLQDGSRLSVEERKKLRADAYCKRQKYALALSEYEELLKNCNEDQVKLKAKLHHNMGVCLCGLFLYDQAAESFLEAFHTYPNTESYVQFLTALKLESSQTEYLSYLADHPESYEDSLEVESRLKKAEADWERITILDVVERTMDEEQLSFYASVNHLLKQAKDEYTNMVNKG